jgi:hypothetical protein
MCMKLDIMSGGPAIRGMSGTNYREEYNGLEFNGRFDRDLQLQHAVPLLVRERVAGPGRPWQCRRY